MSSDLFASNGEMGDVLKQLESLQDKLRSLHDGLRRLCEDGEEGLGHGVFRKSLDQNYVPSQEWGLGYLQDLIDLLKNKGETVGAVNTTVNDVADDTTVVSGGRH